VTHGATSGHYGRGPLAPGRPSPYEQVLYPATKGTHMRAEIESMADEIKQSMALLRRHL